MSLCGFPCFQTKASLSLQKCAVSPHAAPTGVTQTPLLPQHSPSSQLVPQCLQPPHPPSSQVRPRTGPLRRVSLSHGPPRSCGLPGALPAPQPRTPEGKAAPRGPPPLSSGLNTGGRRSPALPAQLGVSSKSPAAHQPRGGGSEAWREPPHTQNGGRALTPPARPP